MKRFASIAIEVCLFLFAGCSRSIFRPPACEEDSARLVARAYVLAIPLLNQENDLIPLMSENLSYFTEDGKAIRCMQALGDALSQSALQAASQNGDYLATERFGGAMPAGLEHIPGQVDASMRSYGSESFTIGQELLWLSQVLPSAAAGNYELYKNTGTMKRQAIRQVFPMYQMLCQMDAGACQFMQGAIQQMKPSMEQQIYSLAIQLGR